MGSAVGSRDSWQPRIVEEREGAQGFGEQLEACTLCLCSSTKVLLGMEA